jgi:hypothetical protein
MYQLNFMIINYNFSELRSRNGSITMYSLQYIHPPGYFINKAIEHVSIKFYDDKLQFFQL